MISMLNLEYVITSYPGFASWSLKGAKNALSSDVLLVADLTQSGAGSYNYPIPFKKYIVLLGDLKALRKVFLTRLTRRALILTLTPD